MIRFGEYSAIVSNKHLQLNPSCAASMMTVNGRSTGTIYILPRTRTFASPLRIASSETPNRFATEIAASALETENSPGTPDSTGIRSFPQTAVNAV